VARSRGAAPPSVRLSLNDPFVRSVVYQVLVVGIVIAVIWYLIQNTVTNLEARKIASGFGFFNREAGFAILQSLIEYSPASTYFQALVVGLLNTLLVAVLGIILSTILGILIGVGRLSPNWLVSKVCSVYVEAIRNVPLAVQLFFWYVLIIENLPAARQALNPMPGVFLSQRGFVIPWFTPHPIHAWLGAAFVAGIVGAIVYSRWAKQRQERTGQQSPVILVSTGLIVGLPLLVFLLAGAPLALDVPELRGFNFSGGVTLIPEFAALLLGLTFYTASFNAEIVRSGILAISQGQTEAASALGLRRSLTLRLVILPQALRVIIPPMTSQYLNLTKNSSLAILIGYPDLVFAAMTVINQTGQAIEGIGVIMAVFLTVSLSIAAFMNWYNKKIALVER
jgi:general L-amino acid transport system permease protein